jgi:hypothetical protein
MSVTVRRSLLALLVLILIGGAINLPLAVQMLPSRTNRRADILIVDLRGAEAAAQSWPAATPHDTPWPPPTTYQVNHAWGLRSFLVHAAAQTTGVNGHQMQVELVGWPLPVFERVQMWWPWDDPRWQTSAESDPAMRLHWPGVIVNPLIFGGGAWIVLIMPLLLFHYIRRYTRLVTHRCPACGYPAGRSPTCTECGAIRPA